MLEFLLVLALLAVVVWVISGPLRSQTAEGGRQKADDTDELEAAKEAKYREIREAEMDYRTGKLSEEDWQRIDLALRAEAIEILKREDEQQG